MALYGRQMTPQQIAALLPDVPLATLYRHIKKLHASDVLSVVESIHVRGTVAKVYAVSREAVNLTPDEVNRVTPDEHVRYFTRFVGFLLAQFRAYMEREGSDPVRDGVSYRAAPIYLSDEEYARLIADMRVRNEGLLANSEAGRRRRLFASIVIPYAEEENRDAGADDSLRICGNTDLGGLPADD